MGSSGCGRSVAPGGSLWPYEPHLVRFPGGRVGVRQLGAAPGVAVGKPHSCTLCPRHRFSARGFARASPPAPPCRPHGHSPTDPSAQDPEAGGGLGPTALALLAVPGGRRGKEKRSLGCRWCQRDGSRCRVPRRETLLGWVGFENKWRILEAAAVEGFGGGVSVLRGLPFPQMHVAVGCVWGCCCVP